MYLRKNKNIVITKTLASRDGPIVISSVNDKMMAQFRLFPKLIDVIKQLNVLVVNFQNNNLQPIFETLTQEYFVYIAEQLNMLKRDTQTYSEYENDHLLGR